MKSKAKDKDFTGRKKHFFKRHRLKDKTTGIITGIDYKKVRFKVLYGIIILILIIAALVALLPIFWLVVTSFKSAEEIGSVPYNFWPEVFSFSKIAEVWSYLNFGKYFLNTIIVVVGAIICSVVFNGLMAYVFAIVKPKGYQIIYALVMLSYMIPTITAIVPLFYEIVTFGGTDSYIFLWLAYGANAYYLIMFKNYFESLPKALFEAAEMDGCGKFKAFFRIVVPLSLPIISVVAIFTMTAAWSDFLLPYLVLYDDDLMTIMVKIYQLQATMSTNSNFSQDMLLMILVISIVPQIIIFLIFQKQITNSSAAGAIKE